MSLTHTHCFPALAEEAKPEKKCVCVFVTSRSSSQAWLDFDLCKKKQNNLIISPQVTYKDIQAEWDVLI